MMTKRFATNYDIQKEDKCPTLCSNCNRNQELKMYQLNQFEPQDPNREDEEFEEYSRHIEQAFRLCRSCKHVKSTHYFALAFIFTFRLGEARVRQVIGEQDSKLKPEVLSFKLSKYRKSPLNSAQDLSASNVCLSSVTLAILLTLAFMVWLPSLVNTRFQFIPLNLKTRFENLIGGDPAIWLMSSYYLFTYEELITVTVPLALTIGYFGIPTSSIRKNVHHLLHITSWLLVFFQRVLENSSFKCELATFCLLMTLSLCFQNKPLNKEEKIQQKRKIRRKLYEQFDDFEEQEVEISTTPTPVSSASPAGSPTPSVVHQQPVQQNSTSSKGFDLYLPNHEICQKPDEQQQCDISTLQIDGPQFLANGKGSFIQRPSSPFSIKEYDTSNQSMIDFGDVSSRMRPQDSMIKPARFVYSRENRIAQSSWVAGGYWHSKQSNEHNETLSRTSSQSSGFGSLTSAAGLAQQRDVFGSLPNSRLNSVCGGDLAERFSVFSEPAYKFNHSGLNNTTLISQPSMIMSTNQRINSTMHSNFRSRSVLGGDDSFNSSKFSEEAFGKMQPKAESSPKDSNPNVTAYKLENKKDVSFLERKISINFSVYSLFLFTSCGLNFMLLCWIVSNYW